MKLFMLLPEDNAEKLWLHTIKKYVEEGGSLSATYSKNGWTLLHYASENLFSDVVKMLLCNGSEVNSKAENGSTPYLVALDSSIDFAIQYGEPEINFSLVKTLIEHGANVDACSSDGISRKTILEAYGTKASDAYYEAIKNKKED
jgi:ankyrin repeat protein